MKIFLADKKILAFFLRKLKVFLKKYLTNIDSKEFTFIKKKVYGGIKGLKDELSFMKSFFQKVYEGNKYLRFIWEFFLTPFSAHCILLVFKKEIKE